uniref:Cyclic nucleotide-gated ion channel 5 family protein n=1 Tax=Rhizophora mucronata TaxID=61149 RepID=A0A2P2ISA2_RHIMU
MTVLWPRHQNLLISAEISKPQSASGKPIKKHNRGFASCSVPKIDSVEQTFKEVSEQQKACII